MDKVVISLTPRSVAFYDNETRIHLTLGNPQAELPEGAELKNIRNGLNAGTIKVIKGDLDGEVTEEPKEPAAVEESKEPVEETTEEVVEETVEEETVDEDELEEEGYSRKELEDMLKDDLIVIAKELDITGYSSMKKDELISAILEN